jgi:hypothetical protein
LTSIDNNNIGLIGGSDQSNFNWDWGVRGHFYYENKQLFGLDDDTPDNIMANSDALADIGGYLNSNNDVNITMDWQIPIDRHNVYGGFFLAHSTPCDTFSVSVSKDTTICSGESLQLNASGGQQYLWQSSTGSAATDLSCTTCPNPLFSGDSSRVYTVQIWNNDSCSVVRPVSIRIKEKPKFSSIGSFPSICALQTGSISAVAKNTSILPVSYALNGGNYQVSNTFTSPAYANLGAGSYVLQLKDGNSCVSDTTIIVQENNPTQALFSALPSTGAAPLEVVVTNNSVFATDYTWFLNDFEQTTNFSGFSADTSGTYELELIAWQNDPKCADTFSLTIFVYDSLFLQIPNVFSPNKDAVNDFFGITSNLPLSINYEIYNRWGNVVKIGVSSAAKPSPELIDLGNGKLFYVLWDGNSSPSPLSPFSQLTEGSVNCSEGVYFYKLEISVIHELLDAKINLEGQKLEFPLRKEGFVHLLR